jgi:histone deacetylase complex subunit SAP30
MGWDDIPLSVLHNYRQAYRLPVPSASSSYRNIVLSGGIGKKTPSRVRARISRDALATAVRKNFNAQPIQENEVIVNFLYTVKNQGEFLCAVELGKVLTLGVDKKFRLSFPPPLGK